jgi:MYXO-CTERM domain-containing protein
MKNQTLTFTLGLALLGTVVTTPAQTSTIVSFDYVGATVQSGGSSAYLGFNPTTGTYLLTGDYGDLFGAYAAAFLGNGVAGAPVCYYPIGEGTVSIPYINIGNADGNYYFSAGTPIGDNLDYGGGPSLGSLGIGDSGYIALKLEFSEDSPSYGMIEYGWAEVQRDADQTYTLLATAYNTADEQSILAGQTVSAVPEPSALVLAALGGLLLFRRRQA